MSSSTPSIVSKVASDIATLAVPPTLLTTDASLHAVINHLSGTTIHLHKDTITFSNNLNNLLVPLASLAIAAQLMEYSRTYTYHNHVGYSNTTIKPTLQPYCSSHHPASTYTHDTINKICMAIVPHSAITVLTPCMAQNFQPP